MSQKHEETDAIIPPESVGMYTQARDDQIRLEALEFAYDASVRSLHRCQKFLDFSAIALAVFVLYVHLVLNSFGNVSPTTHTIVSVVGTGLALLVIFSTLWGLVNRWRGQLEKQADIAHRLHDLVAEYAEGRKHNTITAERLRRWQRSGTRIEADRKHELATLSRRFFQLGHQHVAKKYVDLQLECTVCKRQWKPDYSKQWWLPWSRWITCEGCGVRDEK